jgi:pimeloyl-ACP methyl ester carboxylesterase
LTDVRTDADFLRTVDGKLDINLHRGFASAAKEVLPAIEAELRKEDPVYLAGHSLGGSIAVVLALHLRQRGFTVKCVTFGQPKVTDTKGAAKAEGLDLLRFIHGSDPVAMVPPAEWHPGESPAFYAHFGREIVFSARSFECLLEHYSKRTNPVAWWNMADLETLADHEMSTYLSAVQSWADR